MGIYYSSFLHVASGDFHLLIGTFANSLDPDQTQQNVWPDQDQNCLTLRPNIPERIFLKKWILKKKSLDDKKHAKLPSRQIVKYMLRIVLTVFPPSYSNMLNCGYKTVHLAS